MIAGLSETSIAVLIGIGGVVLGVVIALVGQLLQSHTERRARKKERQLQDLVDLENQLVAMTDLWFAVKQHWSDGADVPLKQWRQFVVTRARVHALTERLPSETLRSEITNYRLNYGVTFERPFVQGTPADIEKELSTLLATLGERIRVLQ